MILKMKIYFYILFGLTFNFNCLVEANLYLTNSNISTVLRFTEESCDVFVDEKEISKLLESEHDKFTILSNKELEEIQATCMLSSRFNLFGNEKYGFIYPGTLWCGRGSKARSYSELGTHAAEDSCCRDHDNCPNSMEAGACKGAICNTSSFTRSHCECDKKFQECLRNSGTETGNTIGAVFFNIAQIFCFREIPNCSQKQRIVVEGGNKTAQCPFEFIESQKYNFTEPRFTLKNSKAFLVNYILRKFA